jgi:hypothetical protein
MPSKKQKCAQVSWPNISGTFLKKKLSQREIYNKKGRYNIKRNNKKFLAKNVQDTLEI